MPALTELPILTPGRRISRRVIRFAFNILIYIFLDLDVRGRENIPAEGPFLIVLNHLGHPDAVLVLHLSPVEPEGVVNVKWRNHPLLGPIGRAYGVLWIEPFSPDSKTLKTGLRALKEGRVLGIAPEGRVSATTSLEAGRNGPAFLALRSGAPVLPIAIQGSEQVFDNMLKLRKTRVQISVGALLTLADTGNRRADLRNGTDRIMRALAGMLSDEYRGVYADAVA